MRAILGVRYDAAGAIIPCPSCQHYACVCKVRADHAEACPYRRAAGGDVAIECDHGRDVCPICDPCTCPAGSGPAAAGC